ncbi:hypothetical protein Poly21_12490 [Allorhodopirellula heiligendammensis]|uniref:Uncharacterized protein n=1 Tax=Allorhodopirellula heiligendammensis TaxID=2714739 RepID=A0A5C6C4H1_9BACT|nr:hypothetical protein Poly21_12490 [Allorhodopirellula heiligendammensis]
MHMPQWSQRCLSHLVVSLVCFALGIATASVFSSGRTVSQENKTFASSIPVSLQEVLPAWMKSAESSVVGDFALVTAKEHSSDALCYPRSRTHRPLVLFSHDADQDAVDTVSVFGKDGRHLTVIDEDGDGTLDSYVYVTGTGLDSIHFVDSDMDGRYDHRMGPGKDYAVHIAGEWRELTRREGKPHVEMNGEMRELEQVDQIWQLPSDGK